MEGRVGRHVAEALEAHRSRPIDLGEESRRLYEQVGALYGRLQLAGEYGIGSIEEHGVEEFADFLDTVYRVITGAPGPRAEALRTAIRRYEHDRTGGQP